AGRRIDATVRRNRFTRATTRLDDIRWGDLCLAWNIAVDSLAGLGAVVHRLRHRYRADLPRMVVGDAGAVATPPAEIGSGSSDLSCRYARRFLFAGRL